ncbi:MAG: carbohydrate binding family 9 domain-containing protein, partial [Candidatus Stahlbacteria bacterium]|nr:carbohydrate binding family 9 domain-containing protein [Candidatus Stahlbacteria bacterium]
MLILFPLLVFCKIISLPYEIDTPLAMDGNIEFVYDEVIYANDFVQWYPTEDTMPSESTKVFVCHDKENIYIVFQCFELEPDKLDNRIVPRDAWYVGDNIGVLLDVDMDKNTGYQFYVSVGGVQCDSKILDDGRNVDPSEDWVWYSAAKITDYGYNVEMKIPFKTLRFKPGLTEWGVNFFRGIARKNEYVSWAPLKQSEGLRVSRCGILKGINPGKQGLHLEVYPVGLASYEHNSIYPQAGLDFNWCFTSSQLSFTTYPDFAQIEADPYTMNLSKYETYFQERRPFFIESQEVFNTPIKLF